MANQETLKLAVMWYMAGFLPILRKMSFDQRKTLMNECLEITAHEPLHMTGSEVKFPVPCWSPEPLTGGQIIALSVGVLWCQCGENPEMCSSLYETWHIADSVAIADLEEKRNL